MLRSILALIFAAFVSTASAQPLTTQPPLNMLMANCGLTHVLLGGSVSPGCGPTPTRAGDLLYFNGTTYVSLPGNNSGTQLLQETSAGVPSWVTVSGTGTVTSITCFGTAITSAGTCATAAAKSDEQAGSSATLVVTPSQQQSHDSAAKAWVNFSGSGTNGAQTVNASYNVSGVSRTSTGVYAISFTTSFASSAYACSVTINSNSTANLWGEITSLAAGNATVAFLSNSTTTGDPSSGMIICFGRQ